MSSPVSASRRKSKAAWSKQDDIRLCRAFVLATQDGEGSEHVKNMWTRVFTHYAALLAEEDPAAAPRAGGALQTHWSSFIRPESAFFMSLLVKVESEEHDGWKEEDYLAEAKTRFEAIRQAEELEAVRVYEEVKQEAVSNGAELPSKPRLKAATFRYTHCIPVLRTSNRFMRAATAERKPRVVRSPAQRRGRPKLTSDANGVASEASDESMEGASPQPGPSPKKRKASEASSGSVSHSSSSSSSPSDESSDEGVPAPKGFAIPIMNRPPAVVPAAARENVPPPRSGNAQNGHSVKPHALQTQQKSNYRLKLLAELRGMVETISQLSSQLTSVSAVPMGMGAATRLDPMLTEEVQQDLRFFREQKRRLKQELDALDAVQGQS